MSNTADTNQGAGRLAGKIVLVTGASRGVGLCNAKLMAAEGAHVIMTDINADTGSKAAAEIGGNTQFYKQDVSSEQDWAELVAKIDAEHGRLDVLVNNAAILQFGEINNESLEGWRRIQSVNADGVFLGIHHCLPLMEKSGGGSIVNMSSSAAVFGMPYFVAYSASKAAVRGITKAVAVHCHRHQNGVRCNSIHPDGIATDMPMEVAGDMPELDSNKALQAMSYTCMPDDIAKIVLFLASDDSVGMNGAALNADKSATITPPYL